MQLKLHRIHTRWRRIVIKSFINFALLIGRTRHSRSQIHWIGYRRRPRRLERHFIALLILGGTLLLSPNEYVYWSTFVGGMTAIFLNLYTIYRFIPRKQAHWIRP